MRWGGGKSKNRRWPTLQEVTRVGHEEYLWVKYFEFSVSVPLISSWYDWHEVWCQLSWLAEPPPHPQVAVPLADLREKGLLSVRVRNGGRQRETVNTSVVIFSESFIRFLVHLNCLEKLKVVSEECSWKVKIHVLQVVFHLELFQSVILCPYLFSSAFALWANAELYTLVLSLTVWLSVSLHPSSRKLEKSLNFDARALKFCMRHLWT